MARVKVKPPARLARRPGDEELTIEQLKHVSLFANLSRPVELEQFPGTALLRRYEKGEQICRQNDPGWTAFYILTTKDLLELRQSQLKALVGQGEAGGQRAQELQQEIAPLQSASEQKSPASDRLTPAASVHLADPANQQAGLGQSLRQSFSALLQRSPEKRSKQPGTLVEGELFGEMSCLYRIPRTATVVAERECHVLTFLRNILDKMYANKAFKDQVDSIYRQRVLELYLKQLPVFRDLPPEVFRSLRDRVELLPPLEPGDIICDEHERPDCMYIIRSGFVKLMKNSSYLLGDESIADWKGFCASLLAGEQESSGPRRKIWELLSQEPVRAVIRKAAQGAVPTADEKALLLYGLNDLLKQPKLQAHAEFKEAVQSPALSSLGKLPAGGKKWSQHQQICEFNRRLLGTFFPELLLPQTMPDPSGRILDYLASGDYFGETGVLCNTPRNATCVAYVHHGEGKAIHGRVELVRIGKELFDEIRNSCPPAEESVARVVEERNRSRESLMSLPVWQEHNLAARSERFDDLGLIQGQKLMLIDLDRCTRCDKCVEACVRSHHSHWWDKFLPSDWVEPSRDNRGRLFLDGPRFTHHSGSTTRNYLVPSTCRQCRDPICLVGCPVGSIHKGDNAQIVIEDWCIGCSRCAEQCPYGSIQMHAIGIVEKGGRGWTYGPSGSGPWLDAEMPFKFNRELREKHRNVKQIYLRRSFELTPAQSRASRSYRLQLLSLAPQFTVQFNGHKVLSQGVSEKAPTGKEIEALLVLEADALTVEVLPGESPPQPAVRVGHNLVEASVSPTANPDDTLLDLGLYAFSKPVVDPSMVGEFSQEVVTKKAVVCDMCGSQWGQQPACVNACPHDAAMRVDARSFFQLH